MRSTVAAACVAGFVMAAPASSTTFFVDRTDDTATATACTAGVHDCSLRGAIIAANTKVGADIVQVPAGTYTLTIAGAGEDSAATGDLDVRDDLTLVGAGAASTIIDGGNLDRVLHSDPEGAGIHVTVSGVTIQHGVTTVIAFVLANGGAVRNGTAGVGGDNIGGTLTIANSVIRDSGTERDGGGIANAGTLILVDSTISGNAAENGGGLKQEDAGSMSLTRCTVSGNQGAQGGGLFMGEFSITPDPMVTLVDSTVSGNTSPTGSGIFYNRGTITLTNTTISGNGSGPAFTAGDDAATFRSCTVAANVASGIAGGVTLANTILAGNGGADCSGTLNSAGYNLIQNASGCTLVGDTTGNVVGMDPMLGGLTDNGGPTKTHAIPFGSPALDAGNPAVPGSGGTTCPATDQRGIVRPKPQGGTCDIGAFELDDVPPTTISSTSSTTSTVLPSTTISTSSSTSSSSTAPPITSTTAPPAATSTSSTTAAPATSTIMSSTTTPSTSLSTSTTVPTCGNAIPEGREECDDGTLNGRVASCCREDCSAKPVDVKCGDVDPLNECDQSDRCDSRGVCQKRHLAQGSPCTDDGLSCTDDVCDEERGECSHPARELGTPCGETLGSDCDLLDFCDGTARACPVGNGVGKACSSDAKPAPDDSTAIDVDCEALDITGSGFASSCDAIGFKAVASGAAGSAKVRAGKPAICTLPVLPDVAATRDGPQVTRKFKKQRLVQGGVRAQKTLRLKLNRRGKKLLNKDGCLTVAVNVVVRQGSATVPIRRLISLRR